MLFNSPEFLFLFLPIVLIVYRMIPVVCEKAAGDIKSQDLQIIFLFVSSLFFYGHWRWQYVFLILLSIGTNYTLSALLAGQGNQKSRKMTLWVGIVFNLGLLGFFKYANFFISNVGNLTNTNYNLVSIVLPIGISFFTFQQIAYLVDRYRGQVKFGAFWRYGLFVTFFPQLIAGPIVHHSQMMPQFDKPFSRDVWNNLALGGTVFIIGLFKKMVIADSLSQLSTPVFQAAYEGMDPTFLTAWLGALGYTMQIYFDFSGYSDMAIGLAMLFGIRLPMNFHSPYKATSIIGFWQRWHITLSRFLRDYLYIPLGGNRRGHRRRLINILLTMTLGGLWHGAAWNFVLWGLLHGLFIVVNHVWRRIGRIQVTPFAGWSLTFLVVVIAWVPFRAENLETTARMFKGMAGLNGFSLPHFVQPFLHSLGGELAQTLTYNGLGPVNLWIASIVLPIAMAVAFVFPNSLEWTRMQESQLNKLSWQPSATTAALVSLLLSASLLKLNDVSEFLYFQF